MKIRYDEKGQILAVGDDACDWPEPLLQVADQDLPDDLLAGPERYAVRKGKLAKTPGTGAAFELPAALLAAGQAEPVAALFEPGAQALDRLALRARAPVKKAAPAARTKAPAKKTRRAK